MDEPDPPPAKVVAIQTPLGTETRKVVAIQSPQEPPTAIAPTTTTEQNLHSAGQRAINRVWEYTQALIAVLVTTATLYVSAALALSGNGEMSAFLLLSNAFFLVIGFYFGRTNHTRVGGGEAPYTGR